MRPRSLRSTQVMYAKAPRTRLTIRKALMRSIHQGSLSCSGTPDLHPLPEALCVLVLDPDDAGEEAPVEPRRERARCAVERHLHGLARGDAALACVRGRELDLRERTLELKLRDSLDGLAAEESAVADDLETAAFARPAFVRPLLCRRHIHVAAVRRPGGKR